MRFLFHPRNAEASALVEPVPTVFPAIHGANIAAVFTGRRIAGDFYDSVRVSPQRVLIGLMDAAGRREDNRKILIGAQEVFRASGSELFSSPDVNEADAMTELTLRINRALIGEAGVLSCPAFLACYHEEFGTLCYTNAGHTPGLLRDTAGVVQLGSTGLPLGLFSHATSESRIVAMEKGAVLLLVSRGVIACEGCLGKDVEEFGLQRVEGLLSQSSSADPNDLCTSILNSVAQFSDGAPVGDDRTALALVRMEAAG